MQAYGLFLFLNMGPVAPRGVPAILNIIPERSTQLVLLLDDVFSTPTSPLSTVQRTLDSAHPLRLWVRKVPQSLPARHQLCVRYFLQTSTEQFVFESSSAANCCRNPKKNLQLSVEKHNKMKFTAR
jgi:hypothetical protein